MSEASSAVIYVFLWEWHSQSQCPHLFWLLSLYVLHPASMLPFTALQLSEDTFPSGLRSLNMIIVCSFLKDISYAHQGCIYVIENTVKLFNCEILLQFKKIYIFNIFENIIFPVLVKLNFQQPLLQSSVSHDPSEIILICWFAAQ